MIKNTPCFLILALFFFYFPVFSAPPGQSVIHTVKTGETLYGISRQYAVPLRQLKQWNSLKNINLIKIGDKLVVGQEPASPSQSELNNGQATRSLGNIDLSNTRSLDLSPPQARYHQVQKGDTFNEIAAAYGLSPSQLLSLNQLSNINHLSIGQKIRISLEKQVDASNSQTIIVSNPDRLYKIKAGDTSYGIARTYGLSPQQLALLNPQVDMAKLSIGDQLVVGNVSQGRQVARPQQVYTPATYTPSTAPGPGENRPIPQEKSSEKTANHTRQHKYSLDAFYSAYQNIVAVNNEYNTYAVIVGVSEYPRVRSLRFPDDDAYSFYSFLLSLEGGALNEKNVALLVDENATRANILKAIREKFSQADENDAIVFYYAGHGIEHALITHDYDGTNPLTFVDISMELKKSKAPHRVAIIDACHSGSAAGYTKGIKQEAEGHFQKEMTKNIHSSLNSVDKWALFSSTSDELSIELEGVRHGLFTYFLIEGLKGNADKNQDRLVTLRELYGYLFPMVQQYSQGKQHPMLLGEYNPDQVVSLVRNPQHPTSR